MRIVMGSNRVFVIGERGVGCTDHNCDYHPEQPFVVLREVDRSAWLANLASHGVTPHDFEDRLPRSHYYEVAID